MAMLAETLEFRPGESAIQVSFLNVLDDVPTHIQMFGYVLDRHTLTQFQSVSLELAGITPALIGETKLDLTQTVAGHAKHPLHGQHYFYRLGTDGHAVEPSVYGPFADNLSGTAQWANKILFSFDNTEFHFSEFIPTADVLVATDTKGMIQ